MSNVTSIASNGVFGEFSQYVITNPNAVKGGTDGSAASEVSPEHVNL
ncbi:MAG: hypothetical protein R3E32_13435 [Chitinophagales bacterium]